MTDYTPEDWVTGDTFTAAQASEMSEQIGEEEDINVSQQAAIAARAPVASPTFTGLVTTPAIKITTGAAAARVFTSDATGLGSWQVPTGGTGGGDASTNTATSVDSEAVLFSGTTGKILKRATGTGLAKLTSGVLGTATAGTDYVTPTGTETLSNKKITPRIVTTTASATPTFNVNLCDKVIIPVTAAITSMSSGLSGSPTSEQPLWVVFQPTATWAITWGAAWESSPAFTLPATTSGTTRLDVVAVWNTTTSKFRCMGFS